LHREPELAILIPDGENVSDLAFAEHEQADSSVFSLVYEPLDAPMKPFEPLRREPEGIDNNIG
jgi:hypothetical protein